jgi:hypothetical protein
MSIICTYSKNFEEGLLSLIGIFFLSGKRQPKHLGTFVLSTIILGMTIVLPLGAGALLIGFLPGKKKPAVNYRIMPSSKPTKAHLESHRTPEERERARIRHRNWSSTNRVDKFSRTIKRAKYKHAMSIARRILAGNTGYYVNNRASKLGTFLILVLYTLAGGVPRGEPEDESEGSAHPPVKRGWLPRSCSGEREGPPGCCQGHPGTKCQEGCERPREGGTQGGQGNERPQGTQGEASYEAD